MGAIEIKSAGKVYPNGTRALSDVTIDIKDGEFVVLVGPSGCGKTTLLRMVAGLEDITEGEVSIGGKAVNDVAPKDRDIAMVFQNYALYPHMSVFDNMAFSLKLRKLSKEDIQEKVEDAAKTLEISELLDRKPKALSGGQRQRVAMGRAIVRDPEAFLMDEPLSNLDAKLRVQMRAELGQLHNQLKTTTLYVTHDQVEAMTMGDRVAVMRKGDLQQLGTPKEIYSNPNNLFVAGFIGSPSMNFVSVNVKKKRGSLNLVFGTDSFSVHKDHQKKLEKFLDKEIILGIRPEAFEDSDFQSSKKTIREKLEVEVSLFEQLGSDAYIHFLKDIKPVQTEAIEEILEDEGEDISLLGEQTKFIARVNPNVIAKEGDLMTLFVDPEKFHYFEINTGKSI